MFWFRMKNEVYFDFQLPITEVNKPKHFISLRVSERILKGINLH